METLIVILIVSVVLILAARSIYRTLAGKDNGCGCRAACPLSRSCGEDKPKSPHA